MLHTYIWFITSQMINTKYQTIPLPKSLTADPGVVNSIPARSHTFLEIDHEIISPVILLHSAESFKNVHQVLVNRLFKLAQEKVWLVNWQSRHDLSCWLGDVKQQNKQTNSVYQASR